MASGTARTRDSTHMDTISKMVSRGMPTPWTRLQEATALYLWRVVVSSGVKGQPIPARLELDVSVKNIPQKRCVWAAVIAKTAEGSYFGRLSWLTKLTRLFLMHGWQRTKHNKPLRQLKRIKMLRIDGERWSIVYFKYLIFIFFGRRLGGGWARGGRWGFCVCWLVFPVPPHTCLLVCFINGNHLSKCFSKILHQDFMGKNNIFFMTHLNFSVEQHGGIYISPSGNVSATPPTPRPPLVLQSRRETEDFPSGQECNTHAHTGRMPAPSKKSVFNSRKRRLHMSGWIEAHSSGPAFRASNLYFRVQSELVQGQTRLRMITNSSALTVGTWHQENSFKYSVWDPCVYITLNSLCSIKGYGWAH